MQRRLLQWRVFMVFNSGPPAGGEGRREVTSGNSAPPLMDASPRAPAATDSRTAPRGGEESEPQATTKRTTAATVREALAGANGDATMKALRAVRVRLPTLRSQKRSGRRTNLLVVNATDSALLVQWVDYTGPQRVLWRPAFTLRALRAEEPTAAACIGDAAVSD